MTNHREMMGCQGNFIIIFWDDLGDLLYDSFMEAKLSKELSASQRQAIIKLLEKIDKDRRFIKD